MAGYEARAFRGCGIFTSEPYEVSDDADSVQMLTRSSQIGEFYVMSPPQVPPPEGGMAHCCDIVIFDEEAVGPLLNLLEYLFKRSPEQIAEKVTDKIVETERKFSQGTVHTMDDYLGSRFKWRVSKSAVAGFRLVFVKFAIIFALVLF